MKRFLKVCLVTSIVLLIFAAAGLHGLNKLLSGMCANEIQQVVVSPDAASKVVLFQRDCGATTGFSTQLSLLEIDENLDNKGGNLLVIEGQPDEHAIEIDWVSPSRLRLHNVPALHTYKKESSVNGVSVVYE